MCIMKLSINYRCPVDNYVFPALDRSREGDGLEARFNAFKIPESNFLVFEATVKTCREGCPPVSIYCIIFPTTNIFFLTFSHLPGLLYWSNWQKRTIPW